MRSRHNVRAMRRIGRRGLASACIEGMLATSAPFLAVMDADLQHDEEILPVMLKALQEGDLDLAVGTRFAPSGGVGDFSLARLRISKLGRRLSRVVSRADLSDPMSGFFVLRRTFFEDAVRLLSGHGFKILLDLFASAPRPVRFVEVPYRFRSRLHGQSKLDTLVMLEFMILLGDKLLGRYIPVKFILFVFVGMLGLFVHLTTLVVCFRGIGLAFVPAQVIATLVAMTCNFNLNNLLTYRDRRLRGRRLVYGHISFYLVCSIGAIANFQIAEMLYEMRVPWVLAGFLGAVVGGISHREKVCRLCHSRRGASRLSPAGRRSGRRTDRAGLASLERQSFGGVCEIVLVDSAADPDGARVAVRQPRVRLVRSDVPLATGLARNRGTWDS